ncbi:MAG: DUF5711 family protein [Clostridia bacterium]
MLNTKKEKALENQYKKSPEKRLLLITQISLGIILIIAASLFIYVNRYHPAIQNLLGRNMNNIRTKTPFSITVDSSENYRFNVYKDNILLCNKNGVKAIKKSGEEEWSITMNLSDPLIQANDKYILIADKGGREVNIVTNYSVVCTKQTEEPVMMARINDTGYFVIVTEEKGYKGKISVYSPSGQEIYKWHSVENYIIDVDVSNDGKKLAVSTIDISKGTVSAGLTFFNLTEERPYAGMVIEGTLISTIKFYKDNSLIAIGDNQMIGFSSQGVQKWNVNYADKDLHIYDLDRDGIIALGLVEKKGGSFLNGDSIIEIYDFDGQKKGSYQVSGEIRYMDVQDNLIALNKKRDICVITPQGNEIAKAVSGKDIRDIVLFNNKRDILVVSRSTLEVLELKRN